MSNYNEMIQAIGDVKETYGVTFAKALIESFGVERISEIARVHFPRATGVAKAMSNVDRAPDAESRALEILVNHIGAYTDHWRGPKTQYNVNAVLKQWGSRHLPAKPVPAPNTTQAVIDQFTEGNQSFPLAGQPTPNDVIAVLLDIAAKVESFVKGGISNASGEQLRNYHHMADALAPLQQLQDTYDEGPVKAAARRLKSFVEATSITITGKEELNKILEDLKASTAFMPMMTGLVKMPDSVAERSSFLLQIIEAYRTTQNPPAVIKISDMVNNVRQMLARYNVEHFTLKPDSAMAVELAKHVCENQNYVGVGSDEVESPMNICLYCERDMTGDTLTEVHEPGCPVLLARQIIENNSN